MTEDEVDKKKKRLLIIRATMKLTRNNIMRKDWERVAKSYTSFRKNNALDLTSSPNYLKKYLKYKEKYMLLKKEKGL